MLPCSSHVRWKGSQSRWNWILKSLSFAIHDLPKAVQPHTCTPEDDNSTLEDILRGTTGLAWTDQCQGKEGGDRSAVAAACCVRSGTPPPPQ